MAVREARQKQERDPADFIGEGRYNPLGPPGVQQTKSRGPKIPPSIEEAILKAAGEAFGAPKKYFNPLQPDDWSATTWPKWMAAYMLFYMTELDNSDIGELLDCSSSTVSSDRKRLESWLISKASDPRNREFAKMLREKTDAAMYRAEEIANCAILWVDGTTPRP